MKQNRWIASLLCIFLLFCTGCTRGEREQVTTTQNNQPSSEYFSTRSGEIPTRAEPYSTIAIPMKKGDPYAAIVKEQYEQYAQHPEAEDVLAERFYALYDIDGNGTDELLFNTYHLQWGGQEYGGEDTSILILDIFYTIRDDRAVEVTQSIRGLWKYYGITMGGLDLLSNGIIRCYGGSPEHTSYAYYRYADGELTFLKALKNFSDTGRWLVTYEGDQSTRTPLTEEEFNRMRAEIEGDAQVVEIDWKPLESYGRE